MTYSSRLPRIAAELKLKVDAVGMAAAKQTAAKAVERAPDAPPYGEGLVSGIEAVKRGNDHAVMAPWYYVFPEFGTVNMGANPFMVPAAEEVRGDINVIARAALRNL